MDDRDKQTTQNTNQLDTQKDNLRPDETGSDKAFVGTSKEKDSSEAYLAENETGQADFAETGQAVTDGAAGNEDIETGTSATRDAALDDGS